MPLSWNEIRHRAIAFSKEWAGVKSEQAEKQTFWNEFFNVFGIRRRVVASFEEPVKGISGQYGYQGMSVLSYQAAPFVILSKSERATRSEDASKDPDAAFI